MTREESKSTVQKQLRAVADKLDDQRVKGAKRLALLRKQAELGDERDAAVVKERREQQDQDR